MLRYCALVKGDDNTRGLMALLGPVVAPVIIDRFSVL